MKPVIKAGFQETPWSILSIKRTGTERSPATDGSGREICYEKTNKEIGMNIPKEDLEVLKGIAERSGEGVRSSSVFLALFSEAWLKDPVPLIQIGIAVMLDKPIAILAIKGAKIPDHIRKIAFAVEEAERVEDVKVASERIMHRAMELGLIQDTRR